MKFATWNVNGLRACMEKLEEFILFSDADIIGLQETKTNEPVSIDDLLSMGYFVDWNFAKRLGYSGTLCLFKEKPLKMALRYLTVVTP